MRSSSVLKRVEAIAVAGALALGLAACGQTTDSGTSADNGSASAASVELSDAASTDAAEVASVTLQGLPSRSVDDLAPTPTVQEGTELTAEEDAQYDSESRAFSTLPADSLLVNDAESFYYEDALTGDEAVVYQTLKAVAQDPQNAGSPAGVVSTIDPQSDEFMDVITTALYALTFDHPEFFWLYPTWMETGPTWSWHDNGDGTWNVYFELAEPYANYEEEMTKFNEAAEEFLADIDTTQSDQAIARQIHDKLIDEVTYDYAVLESDGYDLAHTAYGALVEDSEGNAHYAVCDGYSLAYEYLLQQCGINAVVVVGVGGDENSSGGHAWNEVELGGDWYETDSTWDDYGGVRDSAEQSTDPAASYILEALNDATYFTKLEHYLYNVTTATMSDYEPTEDYFYYTSDGQYVLCLTGESFHTKADDADYLGDSYAELMTLVPDAEGTAFALSLIHI